MAAWRYEISLLVLKKYFTRSLRSLVKYFSTLEEKFRISARPCNILYLQLDRTSLLKILCSKDREAKKCTQWHIRRHTYIPPHPL